MRILLIEDDALTRLDLENRILDLGHAVIAAADANEALAMGAEYLPDIVIADWNLGSKTSGLDVCSYLLKYNPNLYIIMFTGASREHLLQSSFDIPLKNVLAKPLAQKQLEAILQRASAKIHTQRGEPCQDSANKRLQH